jgi:hypothetical protein
VASFARDLVFKVKRERYNILRGGLTQVTKKLPERQSSNII